MDGSAVAGHATALRPDASAHGLDVCTAERQAQAGAADRRGYVALQAHEALEEQWGLVRRDAQSAVAHGDLGHRRRPVGGGAAPAGGVWLLHDTRTDRDGAARWRILGGVREQIDEHLPY